MKTNRFSGVVAVLLVLLAGCAGLHADESSTVETPKRVELSSGDSRSMNYTPWYIHTFSISGPKGTRIGGGGGNMWPMEEDGYPGHSGGQCCTRYPREWQPDLTLTVRWKVDKKMDGKTPGYWYKADNVRLEPYITGQTSGVWAIFLPGDRVKLVVGNPNARDLARNAGPPAASDPYVVQGTLDEEWNRLYRYRGSKK
ncbi:DUF3304 domain-containing protein [Burkholderia multivorans]|jgi:hypothetical protein|uniref:DUF3304 domain-containing protein n=3 Tax=Burkholderia multivorans TaxID=87883 RepID=UPI000B5AA704|nr:DUF3304 domain-containing protein [Burkholderia multivorans]MCA8482232.1 DUF3304 domain-containing protein [Burkholderia multivorans]MCA8505602.1 DUF3304 domain-containing protein [Burkholderia multivorans]MDN8084123.1 DUF3304 domain-containing protein [Burkholderia multivorans]